MRYNKIKRCEIFNYLLKGLSEMITEVEIVKRLLLAAIIGGLIGTEREINNRPAGLRTHILVTVGSALIMLVSIDGYTRIAGGFEGSSRIAAQVVSGIGFLGAGTIMRTGNNINGLTTAASLWVSAGIGLAVGCGYYVGAITTGTIVLLTLMGLGFFEKRVIRKKYKNIEIIGENKPGLIGQVGTAFGKHYISIKDIFIVDNEYADSEMMVIHLVINTPSNFNISNLFMDLHQICGVRSITFEGEILTNASHGY